MLIEYGRSQRCRRNYNAILTPPLAFGIWKRKPHREWECSPLPSEQGTYQSASHRLTRYRCVSPGDKATIRATILHTIRYPVGSKRQLLSLVDPTFCCSLFRVVQQRDPPLRCVALFTEHVGCHSLYYHFGFLRLGSAILMTDLATPGSMRRCVRRSVPRQEGEAQPNKARAGNLGLSSATFYCNLVICHNQHSDRILLGTP